MSIAERIHDKIVKIIPDVIDDLVESVLFRDFIAGPSRRQELFNEEYYDYIAVAYDRFSRHITGCPKSVKEQSVLRNTALRAYYGFIVDRMSVIAPPEPIRRSSG